MFSARGKGGPTPILCGVAAVLPQPPHPAPVKREPGVAAGLSSFGVASQGRDQADFLPLSFTSSKSASTTFSSPADDPPSPVSVPAEAPDPCWAA